MILTYHCLCLVTINPDKMSPAEEILSEIMQIVDDMYCTDSSYIQPFGIFQEKLSQLMSIRNNQENKRCEINGCHRQAYIVNFDDGSWMCYEHNK